MTPLAKKIVEQLTLPQKKRVSMEADGADIIHRMDDVHCFEMSAVDDIIYDLQEKLLDDYHRNGGLNIGELAFLPAQKTWIERHLGGSRRTGWLLISDESCTADCRVIGAMFDNPFYPGLASFDMGTLPLFKDRPGPMVPADSKFLTQIKETALASGLSPEDAMYNLLTIPQFALYARLALINEPRMIGRKVHHKNSSLERKLLEKRAIIGSFPLHAWTEIKLEVGVPENGGEGEAHLTGQKCLHFCRSHLRVRRGRLEVVRGHWRGDASIGIKQSRYSVEPSRLSGRA